MKTPRWTDVFIDSQVDTLMSGDLKSLCEKEFDPNKSNLTNARKIIKLIDVKGD